MVDLDSDPTKLIEIVEIGKQLLITRGSLTTFSIANDVAKYFAIIPAMFLGVLPALGQLNVMDLQSPRSAILSAVIYNAIIIVLLVPLALRGVKFVALTRHGDPAAEPPHLRRRRADRPVHRHQAHRHRRHGTGSELMRRQLLPAVMAAGASSRCSRSSTSSARRCSTTSLFHHKAEGSFVKDAHGQGRRARELIGQNFTKTKYFHPRPSADDYASGPDYSYGSNYGPTDPRLVATCLPVQKTDKAGDPVVDAKGNPVYETNADGSKVCDPNTVAPTGEGLPRGEPPRRRTRSVPVDAVTASGSGLDPDITVANAKLQAPRVAAARRSAVSNGCSLWSRRTPTGVPFGVLGEPAVNVLELNLALDKLTQLTVASASNSRSGTKRTPSPGWVRKYRGRAGSGSNLLPHLGHELADVVRLARRSPDPRPLPAARVGSPAGRGCRTSSSTRCHWVGVKGDLDPRRSSSRASRRSRSGSLPSRRRVVRASAGSARRRTARMRASSSPIANGFVT